MDGAIKSFEYAVEFKIDEKIAEISILAELEEIKTIEFVVNKNQTINFDFENDITPGIFKENSRTIQFNKDGTYI